MSTPSPSESPPVLPPHLEAAPSVPTATEGNGPRFWPLRPVHAAFFKSESDRAGGIISEATRLVAEDLVPPELQGAMVRVARLPSGGLAVVEVEAKK